MVVNSKHLILVLVLLVLVLGISYYYNVRPDEIPEPDTYMSEEVEEIIEPEIPDDLDIPTIEESEEPIEVMNTVTIEIVNLSVVPEEVIVAPGTVIIWVNNDNVPHKIVAYDRLFYGPRLQPGDSYNFTFTQEGSHRYFDAVFRKIVRGKVTVQEEPLPITGNFVLGIDNDKKESDGKFALVTVLTITAVFALSHSIYTKYKI